MTKIKCLPLYIVVQTSASMSDALEMLDQAIISTLEALISSPRLSEFARISIIGFDSAVHEIIPLSDAQEIFSVPRLNSGGFADFATMLNFLRSKIDADLSHLKNSGYAILRPSVILFSNGRPADQEEEWQVAAAELHDLQWARRPHVITCGLGDVDETVLGQIATKAAFALDGTAASSALTDMLGTLLNTMLASQASQELRIPDPATGFLPVPIEYLD